MKRTSPLKTNNLRPLTDVSGVLATRRLLQRLCRFWPRWRWEDYPRWAEAAAWCAARDISSLRSQVQRLCTGWKNHKTSHCWWKGHGFGTSEQVWYWLLMATVLCFGGWDETIWNDQRFDSIWLCLGLEHWTPWDLLDPLGLDLRILENGSVDQVIDGCHSEAPSVGETVDRCMIGILSECWLLAALWHFQFLQSLRVNLLSKRLYGTDYLGMILGSSQVATVCFSERNQLASGICTSPNLLFIGCDVLQAILNWCKVVFSQGWSALISLSAGFAQCPILIHFGEIFHITFKTFQLYICWRLYPQHLGDSFRTCTYIYNVYPCAIKLYRLYPYYLHITYP